MAVLLKKRNKRNKTKNKKPKYLDILAEGDSSPVFPWVREGTSNELALCLVCL